MNQLFEKSPAGLHLYLYVQPGASSSAFVGPYKDRLKLKISARAVEGAANRSVCQFLSNFFGVSKSCVTLVKGERSREKQVFILGAADELAQRLEQAISADQET